MITKLVSIRIIKVIIKYFLLLGALSLPSGVLAQIGLINDAIVSGEISSVGETDEYTFSATAGESVSIRMVELSGSSFSPSLTLYNPDGSLVFSNTGNEQAALDCWSISFACELDQTGSYLLVAADSGINTGTYEIHYKRLAISDENGALVNDGVVLGDLTKGDIDSYTFEATAGESVSIRMVEISGVNFQPIVSLYNPDGTRAYAASGEEPGLLNLCL